MEPSPLTQAPLDVEQLAVENLPLVRYLVREVASRIPSHVDRDDLFSAGQLALVRAARSWDQARGVPFSSYAALRIRGALVDELRSVDWASRGVRRRGREIEDERVRQTSTTGRPATDASVAAALGLSAAEVVRSDSDVARASVISLQSDSGDLLGALAAHASDPTAQIELAERMRYLTGAIEELPERLRLVVTGYFLEERPMTELAVELGVSESRISQLRAEALVLLRDALAHALEPELVKPAARPGGVADRRRQAYVAAVAARCATRLPSRVSLVAGAG